MDIGIRELRDSLSRQLARVRAGETITVTDHGTPIARIVPIENDDVIERLIADGSITPAKNPKRPAPDPIRAKGTISDLVIEMRG